MAGEILDCSNLINQEVISSHETPEVQILRVSSSKIEGMAQDSLSEILGLFDDVKKFDGIDSPMAASKGGKRGLINMKGEYISDFRFDDIKKFDGIDSPMAASKGGKRGLINMKGEYISDLRFDDIKKFDGIDSPMAASKGGKRGLINMKGEYISDLRFDDIVEAFKYKDEDKDEVYFCALLGDKYLLIDNEGKIFNFHVFDSIDEAYYWLKSCKSDSRFLFEKFYFYNPQPLNVNSCQTIDSMILKWLSTAGEDINSKMVFNDLSILGKEDKEKCKGILESLLPENICKLLFGYNFDNVLNSTFSGNDLYNYVTTNYSENYLISTDFGCDLDNKNIYINSNSKVGDGKFLLSLCKRIQRGSDEVRINIPFEKISGRSDYRLNKDNIKIEYLGNDDLDEHIVRLIELLKATGKYYMVPSVDRKLGIFGVNEERNDKNSD